MTSLTCPDCSNVVEVADAGRTARDFCPHCDFPLFWATPVVVAVDAPLADAPPDGAARRLPGAAGRQAVAAAACPTCGELNRVLAETCGRCGGKMAFEPEVVPVIEPEPEPEPVVVPPPPEPGTPLWLVLVLVASLLAIIGAVVIAVR